MCLAVAILPVMDALSKHLTESYGPIQIAAMRFGFVLLMLAPVTLAHSGKAALRPPGRGMLLLRGVLLGASSMLFVGALSLIPLASPSSISFCIASILA